MRIRIGLFVGILLASLALAACEANPIDLEPTVTALGLPLNLPLTGATPLPGTATPPLLTAPGVVITDTSTISPTVATAMANAQATLDQAMVDALQGAYNRQVSVNETLTNPDLDHSIDRIRVAVIAASPQVLLTIGSLEVARPRLDEQGRGYVDAALAELNSAVQLAAQITTGPDERVVAEHQELVAHGAMALSNINLALRSIGLGPSAPAAAQPFSAADLRAPAGYRVELVASGLNFPSAIAIGPDGAVYVAEAGYAYGNLHTPAQVLRLQADGRLLPVAQGFNGPLAGIAVLGNNLYASHKGTITRIDLGTGSRTDIVTGLPSQGDHFNENIVAGPDGKLYFTQGTVTNSGVVGLDNYIFGWLQVTPQVHDVPCRDLTLNGVNFTSANPLTAVVTDTVTTGPYLPFGTPAANGRVVRGETKCSGAVLRINPDGSGLEVFADGFRNPYGLAFHPDGRLFATENGPDERGSRPVIGPDSLYEVHQGGWYGWPDFYAGLPVSDPARKAHSGDPAQPVLVNPPALAAPPQADLGLHSVSNGFDFSRAAAFGPLGQAYIAQFGDLTPVTAAGVVQQSGQMVVAVAPGGQVQPFLTAANGPDGEPVFRPTDARFSLDGTTLYVVHFGQVKAVAGGIVPVPGSGALIRVTHP